MNTQKIKVKDLQRFFLWLLYQPRGNNSSPRQSAQILERRASRNGRSGGFGRECSAKHKAKERKTKNYYYRAGLDKHKTSRKLPHIFSLTFIIVSQSLKTSCDFNHVPFFDILIMFGKQLLVDFHTSNPIYFFKNCSSRGRFPLSFFPEILVTPLRIY